MSHNTAKNQKNRLNKYERTTTDQELMNDMLHMCWTDASCALTRW